MKHVLCLVILASCALAQTSNYPGSLDTNASLFVAADNVQSTLAVAMAPGDNTAIIVTSGCLLTSCGFVANQIATICDTTAVVTSGISKCTAWEHMFVTNVSGQVVTLTRGFAGTTARAHVAGAVISGLIDAAHQSVLKSAVLALESWTRPSPNLAAYGPVATDCATNVDTEVQAAITAGVKEINFPPIACIWIPQSNTITGGVTYLGQPGLTIISAATPTSQSLTIGPLAQIKDVTWKSQNCTDTAAGTYYAAGCRVDLVANADSVNNATFLANPYEHFIWFTSGNSGQQQGVFGNIYTSQSDGMFIQDDGTLSLGTMGIRVWLTSTNAQSDGLLVERKGPGSGFASITEAGGTSQGNDFEAQTTTKTGGTAFNFDHNTSTFNGTVYSASVANGTGGCTGEFQNFLVNNVSKLSTDCAGNFTAAAVITAGGLLVAPRLRTTPLAFSGLAPCSGSTEGSMQAVTDSTTNTWGATITGSGTNHVLAYCDGTNWTVAAK